MQRLKVYFIEINSDERTCFARKTARWLNSPWRGPRQQAFRFEVLPECIEVEKLSSRHAPYYTDHELLPAIHAALDRQGVPKDEEAVVVVFTSLRLAKAVMKKGRMAGIEPDYLGLWDKATNKTTAGKRHVGIISTALWLQKYEREAYRTAEQYIAHMLLAFLGDQLYRGGITHDAFHRCVFDFNDDLDSIVQSVQRSRICGKCLSKIGEKPARSKIAGYLEPGTITEAMKSISKSVRRPRYSHILRSLQEDGVFSLLIFGILASLSLNIFAAEVDAWGAGTLFAAIGFLTLVAYVGWQRFSPNQRLGG